MYISFMVCVRYVSGKLHWCMYVIWCIKYSVTGNRKAVYTYEHNFHSPPSPPLLLWKGVENLYPVCDLAFGGCAMSQCLQEHGC
jgi:hypothetical protein